MAIASSGVEDTPDYRFSPKQGPRYQVGTNSCEFSSSVDVLIRSVSWLYYSYLS